MLSSLALAQNSEIGNTQMCKLLALVFWVFPVTAVLLTAIENVNAQQPVAQNHVVVPESSSYQLYKKYKMNCGVHALYSLLHLQGVSVEYERVRSMTPVGNDGTSLADLQLSAEKLGLCCRILRGGYNELLSSNVPVVAHMRAIPDAANSNAHYVVILNVTPDFVAAWDPMRLSMYSYSKMQFEERWSGHILEPFDRIGAFVDAALLMVLACSVVSMISLVIW